MTAIGWSLVQKRVGYLFFVGVLGMGSMLSWSSCSGMRSTGECYDAGARPIALINVA